MSFKYQVFRLIDESGNNWRWNRFFDAFIIGLIMASVTAIVLESFDGLRLRYQQAFTVFEVVTVVIFTIEYLLRLWTADLKFPESGPVRARLRFMFSTMGLIDLLAILPFYLPFLVRLDLRFIRVLRVVRLLRILKLNRYTRALLIVGYIFREKRSELAMTVFVTFILLLLSSTIMFNLEHDVQPDQFPDIISTFWWAIATLTTVGYGDVYPVTGWGRLVSGIIALLGIGLVALPTGIISAAFIEKLEADRRAEKKEQEEQAPLEPFTFCPHCGKRLRHEE